MWHYSNVFQTSGRVGENCRLAVRDCRCAHNCTARARHRVQLQLFLSQRDWPRRHAIAELQPRHQLPLSSRYFRWVFFLRPVLTANRLRAPKLRCSVAKGQGDFFAPTENASRGAFVGRPRVPLTVHQCLFFFLTFSTVNWSEIDKRDVFKRLFCLQKKFHFSNGTCAITYYNSISQTNTHVP